MPIQFDKLGREIPDPRPMELVPGAVRPESIHSMIQRLIREQVSAAAVAEGEESFEEANDFDVEEEDFDDPLTKYEEMGLEPISIGESEDGPAVGGDTGSAEPSGLRTGAARDAAGSGDVETDDVDSEPSVRSDPPVSAPSRASHLVNQPNGAAVHGRGKRPAG